MKFTEILSRAGVRYFAEGQHHHCRPGWIQLDCPFCGRGSQKYHMGYSLRGNFMNCWKCGSHSLQETVAHLLNISFREAKKLTEEIDHQKVIIEDKRGTLELPKGRGPLLEPHTRYLERRGFDPDEIVRLWDVQGIGVALRLKWRLFIPIKFRGRTVSWTTRAVRDDVELRYISASEEQEEINHKSLLYGEDYARNAIVIVEGPFDVWAIGPGCVGTCGTGYSRAQVNRMAKFPFRAICFDNDETKTAQRRARQLADLLAVFPGETVIVTLDAKDAAEATRKEIRQLRRACKLDV